ncbi:hypothetical protein QN277_018957 [Acacia crassicarpa]|uniref:SHSP domain-containing protein n=1 Tax=Acacia crassicarpa TaxID=499986 RepID=A0AAE1MPT5_9FABA|nr:hypothetical protein QN277_018957 [Acacia crassicarpa]
MDAKSRSAGNRVYEDFEPDFEWQRDETAATLIVLLPGFRRDQLKVQVTSTAMVKIIGEQQISDNKFRRIIKEFSIPSECDTNEVSAQFERGRLYIKFSFKPLKPREEEAKPSNEVSEQNEETVPEKKKKKTVTTSGVVENIPPPPSSEAITSEKNGEKLEPTRQGSLIQRTKTRVLDYTISLRPTLESEDLKKPKNWVNVILLFLFAVVLAIYVQQAFRAFLGVISSKKFEA